MAGLGAGKGQVRMSGSFFLLSFLEALDFALDHQLLVAAQPHAVLLGEPLSAFPHKIDVGTLVEHQPCSLNRVANMLDAADAAGSHGSSLHHERVHLYPAIAGQEASAARVKGFVVLHGHDSGFDGVQRHAAALQHAPSFGDCILHTGQMRVDHVIGYGPGAAMDHQYGKLSQGFDPRRKNSKQLSLSLAWKPTTTGASSADSLRSLRTKVLGNNLRPPGNQF